MIYFMKKINIKIPPFFKPSRNPNCLIKKNLLVPQTSIAGRFISLICDLCHRVWDSRSRTQMPGLMRDQIKFLREKGLREQWPRLAGRTTPGMTHMSCALWENMTWPHMRTTCNTMTSHILIVFFLSNAALIVLWNKILRNTSLSLSMTLPPHFSWWCAGVRRPGPRVSLATRVTRAGANNLITLRI